MTIQKSSNKIKLNDLKVQFLSLRTWIYPLLTFIFLSLGNLYSIKTSYNNIGTDAKNYIFNFGSSYGVDFAIFQSIYEWYPLFILTGILSAFIVFDINFSKKKSTTIMSFALKRSDLFTNRVTATAVWFIISLLLSQITAAVINTVYFGFSVQMISALAILFLILFAETAFGFCVGILSASLSTHKFEYFISSISISIIPFVITKFISNGANIVFNGSGYRKTNYLFGTNLATTENKLSFLNPFSSIIRVSENNLGQEDLLKINRFISLKKGSELVFTFADFLPIMIIFAYCLISVLLAYKIFKNKKFENIGGFFSDSRSIGVVIFSLTTLMIAELFKFNDTYENTIGTFLPTVIISAVGILILSIISLKRKQAKKLFISLGIALAFSATSFAILAVTGSNYSKYIPEVSEIKSAYISESGKTFLSDSSFDNSTPALNSVLGKDKYYSSEEALLGAFTDESDIDTVRKIHKELSQTKKSDNINSVSVYYILKDGKKIKRTYKYIDEETLKKCDEIYNTNALKERYKYLLTADFEEEKKKFKEKYKVDFDKVQSMQNEYLYGEENNNVFTDIQMYQDYLVLKKLSEVSYINNKLVSLDEYKMSELASSVYKEVYLYGVLQTTNLKHTKPLTVEQTNELKSAIAKDIDENNTCYINCTDEKQIGFFSNSHNKTNINISVDEKLYTPIYPSMKNTIKLIKEYGLYDLFNTKDEIENVYVFDANVNDIYYDSVNRQYTTVYTYAYNVIQDNYGDLFNTKDEIENVYVFDANVNDIYYDSVNRQYTTVYTYAYNVIQDNYGATDFTGTEIPETDNKIETVKNFEKIDDFKNALIKPYENSAEKVEGKVYTNEDTIKLLTENSLAVSNSAGNDFVLIVQYSDATVSSFLLPNEIAEKL